MAGLDLLELAPLFRIHLVLYGLNCTSLVRPQYFHPEDEEDIIPSCTANHQSNAWWVTIALKRAFQCNERVEFKDSRKSAALLQQRGSILNLSLRGG